MSKSLFDYFSKKWREVHLPDPRGPLSSKLLPFTIAVANTEVMHDHGSSLRLKSRERRGVYNKYTPGKSCEICY